MLMRISEKTAHDYRKAQALLFNPRRAGGSFVILDALQSRLNVDTVVTPQTQI